MEPESADVWAEIAVELSDREDARPVPVSDGDADWLRRVPYSFAVDAACETVSERHGLHRVVAQGTRCRSSAEALCSVGDALEFPSYYGRNYDAMNECLQELLIVENGRLGTYFVERIGRRARGVLLQIDVADQFLVHDTPEQADTFMSVLRRGAHPDPDPSGRPPPEIGSFHVLLFDRPGPPDG